MASAGSSAKLKEDDDPIMRNKVITNDMMVFESMGTPLCKK